MEPTVLGGADGVRASVGGHGSGLDERQVWLGALDELLSLAEGLLADTPRQHLAAARTRVAEDRFNLVVLGEFKRGKSTLINALLERDVLPTGVVPLTSVVTTIAAGDEDRLRVYFHDGRAEERPLRELAEYVTEARNPANRLGVELARVELGHDLLRAGLELVDTPGIGSIHSHNTEVARGFLPQVDAALCVLDAGQPLSQSERELFREAAERVPRLLVVINKIDHLDPADREVAVEFIRSALRNLLGPSEVELFAISARPREGLAPLLVRLRKLAATERHALLLRSVAQLARGTAAEIAQAARFESRAIELPLDQLSSRAEMFEQRIAELADASAEAEDLLQRGIDRALGQLVNEPLEGHARREEPRLRAELRARLAELAPQASPRELSDELGGWIDTTVRAEFERLVPRFEAAIAEQLSELEERYAQRIERILDQVQQAAEDVFGVRASEVLPDTGLRAASRFSFKLKDVEHALDMLVGFGRTITPGRLGRRLVIRDAEQRLIEMTDRHAGRLRSELAGLVAESVRDYRRDLAAAVDEAIDAIRGAIERAAADRRRGEQHARGRLDQLARIEQRCTQLSTDLDRWIAGPPPTGKDGP
ncbi:MAG TPA: dynamin family protein [Solirubrobacteraceae bacterium]|nr:dynamin family protein [Solirubrobacteraceae bacterium]